MPVVLSAALLGSGGVQLAIAADMEVGRIASATGLIGAASVLQVRPNIYMLTVDGINVALQIGGEGAVVVNAGPSGASDALLAAIKQLSPQPIRYIISTDGEADVIGGNQALAAAGRSLMQNPLSRPSGDAVDEYVGRYALIVARRSLQEHLVAEQESNKLPTWALPTETFSRPEYNFFLNGEPISVIWQPAAHSDDDTFVRFQRSDVVVTGSAFDPTGFPPIDLERGGSIQGELDALNALLNKLTFAQSSPIVSDTGGTLVIPVRGPLSDQGDVLVYRDMVGAMRDRIQDLIDSGKSLEQIKDADPAQGFKARYGHSKSGWTTDQFIEAVYKSLMNEKRRKTKRG